MGENTATDTNTMSAAIRTPRSVRAPCSSRASTGPLITPISAGAKTTRPRPARPIATGAAFRRAPSRARVLSVFPELERGPLALRDDVGLHRLQARVVVGERLAARGILDAPVDHVAQQGDAPELDLELGIRLRVRVGAIGVTHVAGDADRAAEGLGVVEDAAAFRDELLRLRLPDALVARGEGAVGLTALHVGRGGRGAALRLGRIGEARRPLVPTRGGVLPPPL